MPARLIPLDESSGGPIPIDQPIVLVGRHPEVDFRIESGLISRRHCCLAVVNDRILIRDLGSRHGIHRNGIRVEEAELRPGDEVAIAHRLYRLESTLG